MVLMFDFTKLFATVKANAGFVLTFLAIIAAIILVAYGAEMLIRLKNKSDEKIFTTRKMTVTAMLSALATVLMLFDIPMPFAPGFYKLDFSELPVLIGTFAFGPMAGVVMEFLKIVLKLFVKGTSTAFVGELANFCVGCSFILPAGLVYAFRKTKRNAIIGCILGTIVLTAFGTAFNAIYLVPAFARLFGMDVAAIIEMGTHVNPLVKSGDIVSLVIACVAPLNLIKGLMCSIVAILIYKPMSAAIKGTNSIKHR